MVDGVPLTAGDSVKLADDWVDCSIVRFYVTSGAGGDVVTLVAVMFSVGDGR